ncbi:MAG: YtxH domain-containing protein [Nitrospirae bacterium]|nr:MAG: YtxH domain-containing protein [Nitrospirota bacterium]
MTHDSTSNDSCWVTTFVFIAGFLVGAGAALFMAPEPGAALRGRLAKGAKTAQEELSEVAAEAKEALKTLSQETQRTIKHTANRLTEAVEATKHALTSQPMERSSPDFSKEEGLTGGQEH